MNSVKKNFIYNLVFQILNMIVPLLTIPYLARIIGADGIGVYSYSYSVAYYFVLFIMLGLNKYGNRVVATYRDDKNELSRKFSNIYITQLVLGIVLTVIYFFYCFYIAKDMYVSLILGIYVISSIFDINWFFYGLEEFKLTVSRNLFVKILTLIMLFWFVRCANDIYIYCSIMSCSFLVSQIIIWPFLLRRIYFVVPTWQEVKIHLKPNLMLFIVVLGVALFNVLNKIMLGIMADYTQVGYFELSERIIAVPVAFITSLGLVMLPRMTYIIQGGKQNSVDLIRNSLLFSAFTTSSLCFGIMGVADVFVPLFYGDGFDQCIILYWIFLPSCIFLAYGDVVRTQYLLPHKFDDIYIVSALIGASVNIIINIILIPIYGAVGAAIGTFFAQVIICAYQCLKCRNELPFLEINLQCVPFFISGIVMCLSLIFIEIELENKLILLLTKILIGIIIYFSSFTLILFIFKNRFKEIRKLIACIGMKWVTRYGLI